MARQVAEHLTPAVPRHPWEGVRRDQGDGEVPPDVLGPPGERPQPATDRALRQAQVGGGLAVPHAQRGYLQPGVNAL